MKNPSTLSTPIYLTPIFFYTKASLEVGLTLSFDVEVFTLITGSPLDLSITTVLSVPRLTRKQNRVKNKWYKRHSTILARSESVKRLKSKKLF